MLAQATVSLRHFTTLQWHPDSHECHKKRQAFSWLHFSPAAWTRCHWKLPFGLVVVAVGGMGYLENMSEEWWKPLYSFVKEMGYVKQHNATPVPKQALQYVKCKEIKKQTESNGL